MADDALEDAQPTSSRSDSGLTESFHAKLAPDSMTRTLLQASCFLCAYELIKSDIVDCVHDFFRCGFENGQRLYDEARYRKDVLTREPKSKYRASCAWLVAMGGLTTQQVTSLEAIHQHRQEIAHELPKLLIDPAFEIKTELLLAAAACLKDLGTFWGLIDMQIGPDWVGQDIDYDEIEIKSGAFLLIEYLLSLVGVSTDHTKN